MILKIKQLFMTVWGAILRHKVRVAVIALGVLTATSIGVTVGVLVSRDSDTPGPITPDYPPQGTDDNQKPIEGDDNTKIDFPEGGGAIRVTYSPNATADLSEKKITLYYANPGASNQNVRLLIKIGEIYIARSELITPGNYIEELPLSDEAATLLQEGGYNAELLIQSYDPETDEKAMVDTKGELTITVNH